MEESMLYCDGLASSVAGNEYKDPLADKGASKAINATPTTVAVWTPEGTNSGERILEECQVLLFGVDNCRISFHFM